MFHKRGIEELDAGMRNQNFSMKKNLIRFNNKKKFHIGKGGL